MATDAKPTDAELTKIHDDAFVKASKSAMWISECMKEAHRALYDAGGADELAKVRAALADRDARLTRLAAILADSGCYCECDCDYDDPDHIANCHKCLGCRIESATLHGWEASDD